MDNNYWLSLRGWMYNRLDLVTGNFTDEFLAGVAGFIEFASNQPFPLENRGKFYCPCTKCNNEKTHQGRKISNHIFRYGFMPGYYIWYKHGERLDIDLGSSRGNMNSGGSTSNTGQYEDEVFRSSGAETYVDDTCVNMVNDAFCQTMNPSNIYQDEYGYHQNSRGPNSETQNFYDMLEAAKQPLYDGCREGHSRLSAAAWMLNIKAGNEMTERCVDEVTNYIAEILPEGNTAVGSYYELEKLMRKIGMTMHTIDVCVDNCMIFWKEDERWDKCKFCGHPRWKPSDGRTKIPYSRMWYLPIADRLKRLYMSEHASAMRWHAEHESEEGEMCHPSDAAEWKNFNQMHPDFASESRNVYLGLCTDGFNPFGMSKNHSLWPVIMTPYNLPPGMAMKREYLFLTIMNSGPKHPRASLDIFLRPLIDELKELWSTGVEAYDKSTNETFNLRAVLLWTISDFPAYGMLSGWTTHGRLSCPICMDDTRSFQLLHGRKSCWFDCHRRFLPHDHRLRKNKKNFTAKKSAVNQRPPQSLTGEQVYYERIRVINPPKTSDVGGNGHEVKKKGYGKRHNWHKESIFWELPYWKDLTLRHNLDLMHIEKNFFDNIMYTLMNVSGKTKDTFNSRLDIALHCDRSDLHIDEQGRAPVPIFRLSPVAKRKLLECVKHDVRFPDGYASDLASCADINAGRFAGMKSHDTHVFMERLLPFILYDLIDPSVHEAISAIGGFFRDICSRTLTRGRVETLKENIVIIMCNLEMIFPPSFFDVMEHVVVHLPYEAELGGPVQYRWMYPPERLFKHLKGKANNRRYPAGSIVQSYLNDEISYFSQLYFAESIRTRPRVSRFDEGEVPTYPVPVPDIFTHVGRPSGKELKIDLTDKDYECAHAYVLRNCAYFRELEGTHEEEIRSCSPQLSDEEVFARAQSEFPAWVRQYVRQYSRNYPEDAFPTWVQEIVKGPRHRVPSWPMYFTRGYLFHTKEFGGRRQTMNYGVCVRGQNFSDESDEADFYGNVEQIIQLQYRGLVGLKITLFKCQWYDPTVDKGTRQRDGGRVVDVLSTGKYHKYEPFILGSQADQVCYVPYPSVRSSRAVWLNVVKVNPRANIVGNFKGTDELVLLQQENDLGVTSSVSEIRINDLADNMNEDDQDDFIDFAIADEEPEDEFQCNLSSSDDDEDAEDRL